MDDAAELDHRRHQLDALATVGETRKVVQRGELRRVVGEYGGAAVVGRADVRACDRAVVEPEDALDDAVEVHRQVDGPGMAAILDRAAVRLAASR